MSLEEFSKSINQKPKEAPRERDPRPLAEGPCFNMRDYGLCRHGDDCNFLHKGQSPEAHLGEYEQPDAEAGWENYVKEPSPPPPVLPNPPPPPVEDESYMCEHTVQFVTDASFEPDIEV